MGFVTWSEAISYGFSMLGYFLCVGAVSVWLILSGIEVISDTGESLGWILLGFGYALSISGSYGAMYKMIADGVGRGNGHISGPQPRKERIIAKLNE